LLINLAEGVYDEDAIHAIVDSAPVLHVSFVPGALDDDPFPAILPMIGCTGSFTAPNSEQTSPTAIYLHGYISSRLIKLPTSNEGLGTPICIAATHVDGLVLAVSPFNHSNNYRSAIIHGWANIVTDPAEKLYALEQITNHVISNRWENTIPPTDADLKSTGVLRVDIASASAKVRAAGPGDPGFSQDRVWIGVVPCWMAYGKPVPSGQNRVKEVPEHINSWVSKENEKNEKYARQVASRPYGKK
jgi:nitroimidazol reductase NimA-like FMN-containing flavoprotein (pyridoxamine 5'-phosphate oxidase superfamily)